MNNKKLFKGALVLFASILMAVSCSNNSTGGGNDGNGNGNGDGSGGGDGTKKVVTLAQVQAAIQDLGTVDAKSSDAGKNGSIEFTSVTVASAGTVAVDAKKGSLKLSSGELKTALTEATRKLELANTVVSSNFDGWTETSSQNNNTFTITFTANEGYSFDGFETSAIQKSALTITVTVSPKESNGSTKGTWEE